MIHEFFFYNRNSAKKPVRTTCILVDDHTKTFATGTAQAHPNGEPNFSKARGRQIAKGRAKASLEDGRSILFEATDGLRRAFNAGLPSPLWIKRVDDILKHKQICS